MTVREYIGARYVPLYIGQWDNTETYEPLSVVMYQGASYTSRQSVPAGVDIANTDYWALSGNYNAQVEAYRQEVFQFDGRIDDLEDNFNSNGEIETAHIADGAVTSAKIANGTIATIDIADGAVTTAKIADDAVTADKIADSAVSTAKIADANVTTAKIANDAVTEDKIADNAVGYSQIKNTSITPSKLNGDTIKRFWARSISLQGTNLVVFGDSYTQDNIANSINAYWPKRVNAALGTTLFNYAIAGAGFGRSSQLISRQQTNCENDMTSDEASNTSTVICLAGCNDLLNDVAIADINSGIANFITWASTFFPYADIYVIPFNWGFSKLTRAHNILITNSLNSIMTYNSARIHIIPFAWMWNLGIASRFQNEVHPSMAGYNHIAARILNAIDGVESGVFNTGNVLTLDNATGLNSGTLQYNCREGIVYINGYIRPTSAGTQTITIYGDSNLPAILSPNDSLFILPLTDSTNYKNVGILHFYKTGKLTAVLNSDAGANDVCCFNGSFVPEVGVNWSDYV